MKHRYNFIDRTGEVSYTKYGTPAIIKEYINCMKCYVEFCDDYHFGYYTDYDSFKNHKLQNPYEKTVYGIGYLGTKNIDSKSYNIWISMLGRCYSETFLKNNPTYIGCSVCEEWHCFKCFQDWYAENYYEVDNETIDLDKDILYKGNKIYSPETCVFLPHSINTLFVKCNKIRGKYPIGVVYDKERNKYQAHCKKTCNGKNKNIFLGRHNTPEEAFQAYKTYKEQLIKETAELYKDKIPNKLYEAMMNYVVEITD